MNRPEGEFDSTARTTILGAELVDLVNYVNGFDDVIKYRREVHESKMAFAIFAHKFNCNQGMTIR
jgi:hypothetical protein